MVQKTWNQKQHVRAYGPSPREIPLLSFLLKQGPKSIGYSKENLKIHSGSPSFPSFPSLPSPSSPLPAFPSLSPFLPSYIPLSLRSRAL